MKTLVLYYSFSGTTRRAALMIAQALGAESAEIRCSRYRPGPLGYMLAGFDSLRRHGPKITLDPAVSLAAYDRVVLGGPVWTSYLATPVLAALRDVPDWPNRVALFLTAGGQGAQDTAPKQAEELLGGPLEAQVRILAADLDDPAGQDALSAFVSALTDAKPTST